MDVKYSVECSGFHLIFYCDWVADWMLNCITISKNESVWKLFFLVGNDFRWSIWSVMIIFDQKIYLDDRNSWIHTFPLYSHCVSLVSWASDGPKLLENPENRDFEKLLAHPNSCTILKKSILALSTNMDTYKSHYLWWSSYSPWSCGVRKRWILPKSPQIITFCLFWGISPKWEC